MINKLASRCSSNGVCVQCASMRAPSELLRLAIERRMNHGRSKRQSFGCKVFSRVFNGVFHGVAWSVVRSVLPTNLLNQCDHRHEVFSTKNKFNH